MAKKLIKRFIPTRSEFSEKYSYLSKFSNRNNVWNLNRHSVAKAFAIGFFCMWIPVPFQTVLAGILAILFVANLPLSVILVFISNPLTIPAMFYFSYRIGASLLDLDPQHFNVELSLDWIKNTFVTAWKPIVLGSVLIGTISSIIAYISVRILWRLHIIQRWKDRKLNEKT